MLNSNKLYLGIDLGGTNIEAAAVEEGKILASKKIKTKAHKGAPGVIDRIEKVTRAVIAKFKAQPGDFQALCIGAPGAVEVESGLVHTAPNLGWKDVPLGQILKDRLGIPVFVDNDVNIGTAGEHAFGAGRGANTMVGVFVGTGIGGGIIIDGELHYGGRGAAGEVGHLVVVPNGRRCGCGKQGCVEAYASKAGMLGVITEQLKKGRESSLTEYLDKDGALQLSSSQIAEALEGDDGLMVEVIRDSQFYLALLTANLVNLLDPDVIVFGGGLVEQLGEPFVKPIREMAQPYYLQQAGAQRIKILAAALGDHAGTIGAAVVAQQRLGL